ncbi:MAG: serine hydrolase domain-containing protein [Phaeodactylibacter xiamenensis]|uniref:serine hydrolase domain-containing protein n=1 Tax=Phaeodactylibacter xiamenensis TaxID=1524460 RepID=UPI001362BB4B|nr:serine hydrolase domain-containing protein [Phaeodactylibacter xiamenensis]MCR9053064.1 beta-lactamase family protein [bacterium]
MNYFCSVFSGLLLFTVLACNPRGNKNMEPNAPAEMAAESFKPLERALMDYVDQGKVPGGVALVYHKGEMVFHKGFGFSHLENQTSSSVHDIFRIASMTKPVTAVAAMMLYEEGKFKLDDPVSRFIPEFKNLQVLERVNREDSSFVARPATQPMTVRQLFTHSSGLFYGYDNDTLSLLYAKANISEGFEERDISLEENVKRLATLPVMHEPGERYTYGLSIDVLGRLVEIWSGMPLDAFFSERLFKPLGMKDTYFYLPREKADRLVPVYQSSENGPPTPTDYPLVNYPVQGAKTFFSGGADLSSTAWDYFLFCKMMLQKGTLNRARILKPETVGLITSTHLETGDNDMGLGFGVLSAKTETDIARSVGSYSWGGFFATTFWIDPAEEVIAILMLQMYPFAAWDIQKVFEDTVYGLVEEQK